MRKSVAVLAGLLQCDRGLWLGVRGRDRAGSSHRGGSEVTSIEATGMK